MSDIQSISKNNYILQAPPPSSTMSTTALEYDSSGFISGYAGSAFKAGDTLPESVSAATDYVTATSGNINDTINNVSANSGAWGGSALPISAGPGVKLAMNNDTLVASLDETVLWSGNVTGGVVVNLSESLSNFNKFVIVYQYWPDGSDGKVELESRTDGSLSSLHDLRGFGNGDALFMNCFSGNNTAMNFTHNYYWNPPANQANKTDALSNAHMYEIRGINRKQ